MEVLKTLEDMRASAEPARRSDLTEEVAVSMQNLRQRGATVYGRDLCLKLKHAETNTMLL